jgi:hypothetical protein
MTQEDMPNIREIMDKSFDAGYKDAMDFAIKYLQCELHVDKDEFLNDLVVTEFATKEAFIEDFSHEMIKNLCKGI